MIANERAVVKIIFCVDVVVPYYKSKFDSDSLIKRMVLKNIMCLLHIKFVLLSFAV